jgi:hypothetical protein
VSDAGVSPETPKREDSDGGLALLPELLEYTGEFGSELVLFTPFCHWLSKEGLLRTRRIRIYRGMRCFYDDLDCLEILEKDEPRRYVPPQERQSWLPVKNEHTFDGLGRPARHLYPELRVTFRKLALLPEIGTADRPLLIVHNKYNVEWDVGPINHIPLATLETLFGLLERDFTLVYIRHGIAPRDPGFSQDHNVLLSFDDRELLARHPDVLCFDDLYAAHRAEGGTQDLNTFKNVLYSRCYRFISSQGGGTYQMALFSGSLLVILHRRGSEELFSYAGGFYNFMAAVPPILAICTAENQLLRALPLFASTTVSKARLLLARGNEPLLAEFSPSTIAGRRP